MQLGTDVCVCTLLEVMVSNHYVRSWWSLDWVPDVMNGHVGRCSFNMKPVLGMAYAYVAIFSKLLC